ncbi:MAG: hypothetical protein AAF081_04550 [Actinomycetota bacterium]
MNRPPEYEHIPGRYGVEVERTTFGTSTFVTMRPDLAAADGSLRVAAVLMGIDMGAGLAAGMEVLPSWTVTADIETRIIAPCTVGPLRVDSRAVKPGRTMSVVDCRVVDAGAGDAVVALATANHGVLEPTFEDSLRTMDIGTRRIFAPPPDPDTSLEAYFGIDLDADELAVEITQRTRNPWGILHGGLTGLLVEQAAFRAGIVEPTDFVTRYLRSVKQGPGVVRIVETVDRGDARLARIELVDAGTDRVAVVATVGGRRR